VLLNSAAQEEVDERFLGRVLGVIGLTHRGAHATALLFIAPLFVAIRLAARTLGGRVAGLHVAPPELRTPGLGRGLLALGGVGVALALNYGQVYPDLHPRLILSATLLSVLLFEIVASREAASYIASLEDGEQVRPAPTSAPALRPR
jgi:hypothetical protein